MLEHLVRRLQEGGRGVGGGGRGGAIVVVRCLWNSSRRRWQESCVARARLQWAEVVLQSLRRVGGSLRANGDRLRHLRVRCGLSALVSL